MVGRGGNQWWRVGHADGPLDFVPHELCSWEHRFDDPQREYRTLYCAEKKLTALREVLADLRPDTNVRADFARFQIDQGISPEDLFVPAREVTMGWREKHVLVCAEARREGPLADLDDVGLREKLERTHAELLARHGMLHLNISEIRSKNRIVTQTIGRELYEQEVAGILFRSNLDDGQCLVLFENKGWLEEAGGPLELTGEVAELRHVCSEYGLILAD